MAERISSKIRRLEKSEEQVKLENLNEVTEAVTANKGNILRTIRLIEILDSAKLLGTLNGTVRERQVIINKFAVKLNKDIYTGLSSNITSMVFLLGELNVSDLSNSPNKVNKGLHVANQASLNTKTSVKGLLGVLEDDDMNRSLTYIPNVLKSMSRED